MAIPNEQRLIELLTDYLIKADESFERMDKMDEKFSMQQEVIYKQQEFLIQQADRMESTLKILI
jgi:hypothetical protein